MHRRRTIPPLQPTLSADPRPSRPRRRAPLRACLRRLSPDLRRGPLPLACAAVSPRKPRPHRAPLHDLARAPSRPKPIYIKSECMVWFVWQVTGIACSGSYLHGATPSIMADTLKAAAHGWISREEVYFNVSMSCNAFISYISITWPHCTWSLLKNIIIYI